MNTGLGLLVPSPGDILNLRMEPISPMSPALADMFFTNSTIWEAILGTVHKVDLTAIIPILRILIYISRTSQLTIAKRGKIQSSPELMETPVLIYLSTENWGADLWQKKEKSNERTVLSIWSSSTHWTVSAHRQGTQIPEHCPHSKENLLTVRKQSVLPNTILLIFTNSAQQCDFRV